MADLITDTTWTATLVDENDMNASVRDNFRKLREGCGFCATKSAQSVTGNGSAVKMQGNTEVWDSHGYYDNATNYRFTPLIAGKYNVSGTADMTSVNGSCFVVIFKNGSSLAGATQSVALSGAQSIGIGVNVLVDMNGTTDYLEFYVGHNTGSSQNITSNFSAFRVGT
jgi:hypothetical protein